MKNIAHVKRMIYAAFVIGVALGMIPGFVAGYSYHDAEIDIVSISADRTPLLKLF